jgi:type IV pilus assembly protein PilY1
MIDVTNKNLWVYFGTGRYYYTQTLMDDADGKRFLFGIKDPCYVSSGYDLACTTEATLNTNPFGGLTDVTTWTASPPTVSESTANAAAFKGWYLGIDPTGSYTYPPDSAMNFKAERVITDPLASRSKGVVFFTTYKPTADECSFGGKSFIWAVQYNTGGPPITTLQGKALMQVSTGAIEQKDLATSFTDAGGRKTTAMDGKPPEAQGLAVSTAPSAVGRILYLRERTKR